MNKEPVPDKTLYEQDLEKRIKQAAHTSGGIFLSRNQKELDAYNAYHDSVYGRSPIIDETSFINPSMLLIGMPGYPGKAFGPGGFLVRPDLLGKPDDSITDNLEQAKSRLIRSGQPCEPCRNGSTPWACEHFGKTPAMLDFDDETPPPETYDSETMPPMPDKYVAQKLAKLIEQLPPAPLLHPYRLEYMDSHPDEFDEEGNYVPPKSDYDLSD